MIYYITAIIILSVIIIILSIALLQSKEYKSMADTERDELRHKLSTTKGCIGNIAYRLTKENEGSNIDSEVVFCRIKVIKELREIIGEVW